MMYQNRGGRAGGWRGLFMWLLAVLMMVGGGGSLRASDHADPVNLGAPTSNITDLFFFPDGDDLVLIFNINRALLTAAPYDLQPFDYTVNIDLTTPVSFQDPANKARYGGTVLVPDAIHPDVVIKINLKNDTTLKNISYSGLKEPEKIRTRFAVRDDPFIFPRFFRKNVIAMELRIPKTAFPPDQHDFILWGTTAMNGAQIDHVGRSIRTQLPRFGFLNTLAPKDQLKALMSHKDFLDKVYNYLHGNKEWWSVGLADTLQYTFQLRPYDLQPDVMIYSDRFPVGYPNGRLLTDDVVAQTCTFGDCLLQELSFIEGGWPRVTVNDKPFSASWPYLADPWPNQPPGQPASRSIWTYLLPAVIILMLLSWAIVELVGWLFIRLWSRLRRLVNGD